MNEFAERILDLWSDMTDAMWTRVANDIVVTTPSDTFVYHSMSEAVADALYTITEIMKGA